MILVKKYFYRIGFLVNKENEFLKEEHKIYLFGIKVFHKKIYS